MVALVVVRTSAVPTPRVRPTKGTQMTMTSRKARIVAVGTMGIALVVAGCAPGTSSSTPSAASGAVSTAVPTNPVTLKLAFTDNPDMTKALAEAFHAKYPSHDRNSVHAVQRLRQVAQAFDELGLGPGYRAVQRRAQGPVSGRTHRRPDRLREGVRLGCDIP